MMCRMELAITLMASPLSYASVKNVKNMKEAYKYNISHLFLVSFGTSRDFMPNCMVTRGQR